MGANDKRIAWILVELEFSGGLPGDIDLVWGNRRHKQRIDFWGIPFRCLICHRTGHLREHCPFHLCMFHSGDASTVMADGRRTNAASGTSGSLKTGNPSPFNSDEDVHVTAHGQSDGILNMVGVDV